MDPLILGVIFPILNSILLHSVAPMMNPLNEPPIFWGRKGQILFTFLIVIGAVAVTLGIVWMFLVIGWLKTIILLFVGGLLGGAICRRMQISTALVFIASTIALCAANIVAWFTW